MKSISFRNLQNRYRIDVRFLKRVTASILDRIGVCSYDLGVCIVDASWMSELNEEYSGHLGTTDVLAFDYSTEIFRDVLIGEVVVCVDEAEFQSGRFGTSWESELVRYIAHGILHLNGYDDMASESAIVMKRKEDELVLGIESSFSLSELGWINNI
ncbi:MAG: rRNA maturation RNase YbeY [Verrucomicrobia bacterium]|nr:rRNA maturation RNase YbeY [Verrucomicrobiota bacterium]